MRLCFWLLLLTICQNAFGWTFLVPTNVIDGEKVSFQLTNPDGGGYNFPYTFRIYRNNTQGKDEEIIMQFVTATPFYWDNNQPVGTQLMFHIEDVNGFFSSALEYVTVSPNPTFVSSASVQSTASLASINSTPTQTYLTSTLGPPSLTPTGTQTSSVSPTPSPIKTNIGAIAGGVVGGVLLLGIITGAAFFIYRRRRDNNPSEKIDLDAPIPHATVTPFRYDDNINPHSYDGILTSGGPASQTGLTSYGGSTSHGGSSSYVLSHSYPGQNDAPPIYTPPPSSPGTSTVVRGFSQRKGAYAPVSTVPH